LDTILQGLREGLLLIVSGDPGLFSIILLSLKVSLTAVALAALLGIPLGAFLAFAKFPARGFLLSVLDAFMGLPPVVVGLVVYLVLSRMGPLGDLGLLFTAKAMIIAQTLLSFPIVCALSLAAVAGTDPRVFREALSLGATRLQAAWVVVREARLGIAAAVLAGLGRVVAEVGAVMMVGGNIEGATRVMTTSIVLETSMGNFEQAIGLGMVLITIALALNLGLSVMKGRGVRYGREGA
jgi:tungstate transport system permease protein